MFFVAPAYYSSLMLDWTKTKKAEKSFTYDAAKLWNRCPDSIKKAKSLDTAKSEIQKFCEKLPI